MKQMSALSKLETGCCLHFLKTWCVLPPFEATVCMCACTCVHMCLGMCTYKFMCVCAHKGQGLISSVFLNLYFLRWGHSPNLELTDAARLAGQQAPESPDPQCWDNRQMGIRDSVQVPTLERQILSPTEVIFPGPNLSS